MITPEQHTKLANFLLRKNLPIDLLLEVKDHMVEQIDTKMQNEHKDFESSFSEVEEIWSDDLEMKRNLFWKKTTRFQRKVSRQTEKENLQKTLWISAVFITLNVVLNYYNVEILFYFDLLCFSMLTLFGVYLMIFNFKAIRKANNHTNNYSYLQGNARLLNISTIFIFSFILINYENRFNKFHYALSNVLEFNRFRLDDFMPLLLYFLYFFGWFLGVFYFNQFKITLEQIKKRVRI